MNKFRNTSNIVLPTQRFCCKLYSSLNKNRFARRRDLKGAPKKIDAEGATRPSDTALNIPLCHTGERLRREWQKGITAFRGPFKPPRRGPTPDRKRRSADWRTGTGRPAGYRLTSLGTARPSSSRAIESADSVDLSSRLCESSLMLAETARREATRRSMRHYML